MSYQIFIVLFLGLSIGISGKKERIFGGENVDIDEYPHMASLRLIKPHFHFCGGTIISYRHILTAAHCVYDKEIYNIRVYTGSNKIVPIYGDAHVIIRIEVHPLFEKSPKSNHDIAVITLKKNIKFSLNQNKIDLPTADIHDGDSAIIVGWGKTTDSSTCPTEVLQKGQMTIMNIRNCRKFVKINLYDEQLCAYSITGGHTSFGDSGGPLISNGKIVGISSSAFPPSKAFPDIYTNVFAHLKFIKSKVEK